MQKVNNLEEEKKQQTHEYDVKNKRVLPSQGHGVSKTEKKAATKPPMSAKKGRDIFKTRAQMAAEAEAKMFGVDPTDDTFLTGLMGGKKH